MSEQSCTLNPTPVDGGNFTLDSSSAVDSQVFDGGNFTTGLAANAGSDDCVDGGLFTFLYGFEPNIISQVTTIVKGTAPVCGFTTDTPPEQGAPYLNVPLIQQGIYTLERHYPLQEGELVFFKNTEGVRLMIPFVSVEVDGQLGWYPALIYREERSVFSLK